MRALRQLRWPDLAFAVLLLLHLVPIWSVRYPPSRDGPAHLETARALLHRAAGAPSIDREYLALRRDPSVSWFAALVLAGLMAAAGPEVALKVFLSGCLLLLACAMRYALTAVHEEGAWLSLVSLPLLYNTLFLYGFYSFLYGLGVLLVTIGYWLRVPGGTLGESVRLTGLALALQFTHVFCLAAAVITLVALGLARALEQRRESGHGLREALASRVAAPLYAFLPALALAAVFVLPRLDARPHEVTATVRLLRTVPLVSYGDVREAWLAGGFVTLVAVLGVMVAAAGARRRRLVEADGLLAACAGWLVFWLAAPERLAGGSYLAERAALCLLVTFILWCASRPLARPLRAIGGALAVLLTLGALAVQLGKFQEVSRQVGDYVAAASDVAPRSALVPLGTSDPVPPARIAFLEHAASYVAIERDGINLGNYQFEADHFPMAFRQRVRRGRWPPAGAVVLRSHAARGAEARSAR